MFKKLIIFCLLLNFVAVGFVISWTWKVNQDLSNHSEAVKLLTSMQLKNKEDNEKFKANTYQALGLIMSGQSQIVKNQNDLNIGILRVHHFVEPHTEAFYKHCPECQREQEDIQNQSVTQK